ncbi:AAC(3) family N-acetyltransferase [Deinococcus maricopensis]|uniref:Aminoglycoside N(3)-acetyltransferase n=1 Tax=Deinococcus maricopensis (strain DSM 21211 / LMG 22137 / NRRL B-23946 / LB-34) TaxID=709986 RepID=E8UAF3_DEIML|nr:AAC(3) family N-acetyltransferase [Deinococcus maricopensis]ADV68042.1 aminoglycoside 3-N-acetyltransferase [Deinococcus maricopensis DSM 21211]
MLNFLRRPNVTPADLDDALADLGLDGTQAAIAHVSLRSFGNVEGGASAVVDALRARTRTLVTPAFTYYTLLPGPTASIHATLHRESRVSSDIGAVPQALVDTPEAERSFHPALSYVAVGPDARAILNTQSLESPYAPIGALYDLDGVALLLGVDHSSNTSVHYGEHWAGMPLLTKYVPHGGRVVATAFPNCSADFEHVAPFVQARESRAGNARLRAYRVRDLVDAARTLIERDPEVLLCTYPGCRCQEVRRRVRAEGLTPRPHTPTLR